MKNWLLAGAFLSLLAAAGFAQVPVPQAPQASSMDVLTFNKLTGVVYVKLGDKIIMTLKPGDPLPTNMDPNVTLSVVDGEVEVSVGGITITATAGANFTIEKSLNRVGVKSLEGVPVEVRAHTRHTFVLTEKSLVYFSKSGDITTVDVKEGRVLMSDVSGGETKILNAGDQAQIGEEPPAVQQPQPQPQPQGQQPAPGEQTEPPAFGELTIPGVTAEETPPVVIPTQEANEIPEVSPSAP